MASVDRKASVVRESKVNRSTCTIYYLSSIYDYIGFYWNTDSIVYYCCHRNGMGQRTIKVQVGIHS